MQRFFAICCLLGGLGLVSPQVVFAADTTDDAYRSLQWYLDTIQAPTAWNFVDTQVHKDIVVAVLDTGFDADHPDLLNRVWKNTGEIAGNGIDDDGNGFVDDVSGWNFVDNTNEPTPQETLEYSADAISHGTIVAGIIGAESMNTIGIAGIAPYVKLMNVRILDNQGVGSSDLAARGIEYAMDKGAKIINLSFTGFEQDQRLAQVIEEANERGVLLVAAVGNTAAGGIDLDQTPIYPACDGHGTPDNGIIGVSASDETDTIAAFSNYGKNCTDLAAPGVDIISTVYQNSLWSPFKQGYFQQGWNGTSMAAPMVSGAAALLLSAYPSLSPKELKAILRLSADPVRAVTTAQQGRVGAGRLNIAKAFSLAAQLYPIEAEPDSLLKSTCLGNAGVNDPCRAVYFYGSDGARHAFPNEAVFYSWYKDFSSVKEVSASFLASLSLGKNVTYKPGSRLVKFLTVPTVYAVEGRGVLRPIGTEEIAKTLYGASWNTQIDDISDVFYKNYSIGDPLESEVQFAQFSLATQVILGLDQNF